MTHAVRPDPLEPGEIEDVEAFYYALDNIELTSVGIDVGSTTSHLMFSRVHLKRETERHSTRYVVVEQQVLWRSDIRLTPYRDDGCIEAGTLGGWVEQDFAAAGLTPADLDSGAVILTGEALKQHNAKALAEALAAQAGDFVCVSAGHHLEALLSAYGSGSVARSAATGQRVLCVDIGGGTTKLSLIDHGTVLRTAALEVGARMPGFDVASATSQILAVPRQQAAVLRERLLLTGPLHADFGSFDAVTFAGGVAEYVYGRETRDFGDLGAGIGAAIRAAIDGGALPVPVLDPGHGIRATVVGASQSSVQVSGSTVAVPRESRLPLRNVPVMHPVLDLSGGIEEAPVAAAIADALDSARTLGPLVALAFHFGGPPSYPRLRALAGGIAAGLGHQPGRLDGAAPDDQAADSDRGAEVGGRAAGGSGDEPSGAGGSGGPEGSGGDLSGAGDLAVIVVDRDIAASLGGILTEELAVGRPVLCLDNLDLRPLDYLDIGRPIWPAGVYPVVIKSLLFGPVSGPAGKAASQ